MIRKTCRPNRFIHFYFALGLEQNQAVQDFRKFEVWKKAHSFVVDIYVATASFPKHELYGLTAQLRRAAVSIPTNIAEGAAKASRVDFKRFVGISFGSAAEVEYLLLLARELHYLTQDEYQEKLAKILEIKRMLSGLIKSLKQE